MVGAEMNDPPGSGTAPIRTEDRRWPARTPLVLSGAIGIGKTTVCGALAQLARAHGMDVAGILSPARRERGSGIDVLDLRGGQRMALAEPIAPGETAAPGVAGPTTRSWHFHRSGLDWGSDVLAASAGCDLLIIDELGPLELQRAEGWRGWASLLDARQYGQALLVVRPQLVPVLGQRMAVQIAGVSDATAANRAGLGAELLHLLLRQRP